MQPSTFKTALLSASLAAVFAAPAQAAVFVSESAPYASGNTSYGADWFELTNSGSSAVSITGWRMDDNSNSFAASVALRGVSSIGAGQSVIFIEGEANGSTDAAVNTGFLASWFGPTAPAGFVIGNYGGSGVGLSTGGDAVNIFDNTGAAITGVAFGPSTTGRSFDNAAGLSNTTLTQLSQVGVNGAFTAFSGAEVGSPGSIASAVSPVPEPESYALMLAGFGLLGAVLRRRRG